MKSAFRRLLGVLCAAISINVMSPARSAGPSASVAQPSSAIQRVPDGVIVGTPVGLLTLRIVTDSIVRVAFSRDRPFFEHASLMLADRTPLSAHPVSWTLQQDARRVTIRTARLTAVVDRGTYAVTFYDASGSRILAEIPGGRTMEQAVVQGEQTYHVRQRWVENAGESLYGLGQHQLGLMDIKGYDLDLWQHNGTVAIPFLVSSRGWGVLWDNDSYTRFGDLRQPDAMPAAVLRDMSGNPGGLTGSYFAGAHFERMVGERTDAVIDVQPQAGAAISARAMFPGLTGRGDASVRWEGDLAPTVSGDYTFHAYSNGGIKLWVQDQLLMDHWRQSWLPWKDVARVHLTAGRRYHIKAEWTRDQGANTFQLFWKPPAAVQSGAGSGVTPERDTSIWSEVGDGIDYYFVYGPRMADVVAGYRRLTGAAPLMPIWAFGLWQSRQRYETAQQSLDVIDGFRSRGIPFDNIVQDWMYWRRDQWGSHQFDPERFPDPDGWIHAIHEKHAHLMISVWPKFYPNTDNAAEMQAHGFLYQPNLTEGLRDFVGYPSTYYDAFNPDGRALFWKQMNDRLFQKGVDAWWMDATEPDMLPQPTLDGTKTHMNPTALGPGSRVLNAYPLENAKAVFEGQRRAAPNQRVFILTRSGFAGQQRYAAAVWSGDISSTWTALRKQVPAGLGFSISGMPYWTMDIGGFSVPRRFASRNPDPKDVQEWRELNARWFEFGAFVPLLRVHGEFPNREMWEMGGESDPAYLAELKFDRLRYRLLPYIYSVAGVVMLRGDTFLRPLVMDFPADARSRNVADEYLFGPAFLVTPITQYRQRDRMVYLPPSDGWYDFWTGRKFAGGQYIDTPAPYDSMPLDVRAGSIVPFGPELQYTTEKPADPVTLFVYTGAPASFTLYEDDGLSYDYARGSYTEIPIHWAEQQQLLTIGKRTGAYEGMLTRRTFRVVFIAKDRPVPFSFNPPLDDTVAYDGTPIGVHRRSSSP